MVDLTPEWFKEATGKKRYENLVSHLRGLMMQIDAAESLIATYEEPEGHYWQIPTRELMHADLKDAQDSVMRFKQKLRHYESELIAADWKVN